MIDIAKQEENPSSTGAISVSDALSLAKDQLENIVVKIIGEVSELSVKPGYKAAYFTIKDKESSLPCMMWMNRFKSSGIEIDVGSLVEVAGRFSIYKAKGRMNFDAFSISFAGEGELRLRVANLAKKLKAEGLMSSENKKRLPVLPEKIGLVTSPRGAAVHDVLRTLRRRYPLARILLAGVPVEGKDAPASMIEALDVVADAGAELVLLVRGGGSFEDLMPFNDERLARHIASFPIPVVTGIGHEPDNSIADMVADLRASTPTASAEAVSESVGEISNRLDMICKRMNMTMRNKLMFFRNEVNLLASSGILADPMRIFFADAQKIDDLTDRLKRTLTNRVSSEKEKMAFLRLSLNKLLSAFPSVHEEKVGRFRDDLARCGEHLTDRFKHQIAMNSSRLDDLSPLKVLSRGYSIAKLGDGHIIKDVDQVSVGESINVVVNGGSLDCTVDSRIVENEIVDR